MTDRIIRTLTAPEVGRLVDWAADEGWNPGEGDAGAFHAADPHGFRGAFVDGEMVAGISAVAYGADFGFIGLYICRPDRRLQGHGKAVWDAGMALLAGRTVGLDGVPAQQANYRAMGFEPAYETIRWSGRPMTDGGLGKPTLVEASAALLPALVAYDVACFPASRQTFLAAWLQPPRRVVALVEGDAVRGYGAIRPCLQGCKIGPLFADSDAAAWSLLGALAALLPGREVHIDVPAAQVGTIARLEASGFVSGFETARMYKGAPPSTAVAKVHGVTTLELG